MAQLSALRSGIAANLSSIEGLRVHKFVPDQVAVPAAVVGLPSVNYDSTFARGAHSYTIPVRVYASRANERSAQESVDKYIDPEGSHSIKAAVELDETLGGSAHTSRVTLAREYGVYTVAGVDYLGVEFVVEVVA